MLERLEILIGKDSIKKIESKNICILGLGGVGGYALEALIRSGIKNITIVDPDTINESNLNRQIISTIDNIGMYKTDEFEKRILSINKDVNINKITSFIDKNNIDGLFINKYDYFIDACDTIETKKLVIDRCIKYNVKLITSLGMGKRMNPEKIKICKLSETSYDPIARELRKYVKDSKINKDIICCFSSEIPKKIDSTIIGSNSFVPPVAGLFIASYIINDIVKNKVS